MTASTPPRGFLASLAGIALVFAALGPPVGGTAFVPLALLFKAPAAAGAFAFTAALGALFGHWLLLIAAYAIGLGPAAATGVLYALWDAAAPERWPRALAAAVIGGFVAYAVALRLASLGVALDMMLDPGFDAPMLQSIGFAEPAPAAPIPAGAALVRAFVASGAVAGFVCAMAASLAGLTMLPARAPAGPGGAA